MWSPLLVSSSSESAPLWFQINYFTIFTIVLVAGASTCFFIYMISIFTAPRFEYDGKHVLVTGGSSGIGLECAKLYARKGANITIVARDRKKLSAAAEEVKSSLKLGRRVLTVSVDTSSSEAEVERSFHPSVSELGDVDVLVNCAGTSVARPFDELKSEDFEWMMRVNYLGSVYPTRAVIAGMKKKKSGRIIFVSSQVAQVAIHGFTAYAPSKWALRGLAEALQMELKPFGIYVSVSFPPDTDTPGYQLEMQTKPDLTKKISESGSLFSPSTVARDIVNYSTVGYFGISNGLDGFLLKQLHPGMSPINNLWEFMQGVLFASFFRFVALFYILSWDIECKKEIKEKIQGKKDEKKD